MKQKVLILAMVLVFAGAFSLGIFAEGVRREIKATECQDIYLTFNGDEFLARDANENVVYPLIVNGSTYLPVRAVAEIADLNVDWDGETRTVILSTSDYVVTDDDGYDLEMEINDTRDDAQVIQANGTKVKGRVGEELNSNEYDEYDFFTFDVVEQGIISIDIESQKESEMIVEFYNDNEDLIGYQSGSDDDGMYTFKIPVSEGVHYIKFDYDYDDSTYKLDTSFQATPDDRENDYFIEDIDPYTFTDGMELFGAVGTNGDYYHDQYKILDFNSSTYEISLDWEGKVMDGAIVYFYDAEGYWIGEAEFDSSKSSQTISGSLDEQAASIDIIIEADNGTNICNTYTLTISK